MSRVAKSILAALAAFATPLAATQATRAADFQQQPAYYDSGICAHPGVLSLITKRFAYQVRHVPNLPQVGIDSFQNISETRYLPAHEDRPIGRRYCAATALLSDGQGRQVWYLVEEGQGFASIGDNVEFCVSGFDRWFVYNGGCRVLR